MRDGVVSTGCGAWNLSPETDSDVDVNNASFGNSNFAAGLPTPHKSTDKKSLHICYQPYTEENCRLDKHHRHINHHHYHTTTTITIIVKVLHLFLLTFPSNYSRLGWYHYSLLNHLLLYKTVVIPGSPLASVLCFWCRTASSCLRSAQTVCISHSTVIIITGFSVQLVRLGYVQQIFLFKPLEPAAAEFL